MTNGTPQLLVNPGQGSDTPLMARAETMPSRLRFMSAAQSATAWWPIASTTPSIKQQGQARRHQRAEDSPKKND